MGWQGVGSQSMQPFYSDHNVEIYCGDCRQILPQFTNERFAAVLTDPPYSERTHTGARTNVEGRRDVSPISFDSWTADEIAAVFEVCAPLLDGWLISFLDWKHVAHLESNPPKGLRFVRFGIWDKPNGAPQLSGDRPAMGWEAIAILHTVSKPMRWNGGGHRAVWRFSREHSMVHPTQKPASLCRNLLTQFVDEGARVIDPFMGSGTTLSAARDVGCNAVGIEINERYCELAAKRFEQRRLF